MIDLSINNKLINKRNDVPLDYPNAFVVLVFSIDFLFEILVVWIAQNLICDTFQK